MRGGSRYEPNGAEERVGLSQAVHVQQHLALRHLPAVLDEQMTNSTRAQKTQMGLAKNTTHDAGSELKVGEIQGRVSYLVRKLPTKTNRERDRTFFSFPNGSFNDHGETRHSLENASLDNLLPVAWVFAIGKAPAGRITESTIPRPGHDH